MTPYDIIQRKLRAEMTEGQMHGVLRDCGRLAGGYAASGALTHQDVADLERLAISLSINKSLGERTWNEGVKFGHGEPCAPDSKRQATDGPVHALTWDSPIGPGLGEVDAGAAVDYVEPVPLPSMDPAAEMMAYLEAVYRPDDIVSYVLGSFQDADRKWKPSGKGVHTRTQSEICTELSKYLAKGKPDIEAIECALGSWQAAAGGWVRLNPMSGAGVRNDDVIDCRHVLVECDSLPLEQQLATIQAMNLPVSAIVHSGGKSLHAIVRVDAGQDRALYRQRVDMLFDLLAKSGFDVDRQCRNSSRLSRLPGLTRNGSRQYLVSTAAGAASWEDWEAARRADEFSAEFLGPDQIEQEQPDDALLGDRFLTRGGSWLVVAQSGIGKSVLCLQGAIQFAVGRDLFGLAPARPLRNLIIQAENNRLDVQEAYRGAVAGAQLSPDEQCLLKANLCVVHQDSYSGETFCRFLDWVCRRQRPDIVWVDPLLAYIGGEISRMADCARFLRNLLNPVIHAHGIGVIVMHHTAKPPKSEDGRYQGRDLAYLGIGSSDLTNWARATSTILAVEDCENRFCFNHSKRSTKAGCETAVDIMHSQDSVRWILAPGSTPATNRQKGAQGKQGTKDKGLPGGDLADKYGFENMPPLLNGYPRDRSPLLAWIMGTMDEHGEPCDLKGADTIRKRAQRNNLIAFDADSKTWKGCFYDPSFV